MKKILILLTILLGCSSQHLYGNPGEIWIDGSGGGESIYLEYGEIPPTILNVTHADTDYGRYIWECSEDNGSTWKTTYGGDSDGSYYHGNPLKITTYFRRVAKYEVTTYVIMFVSPQLKGGVITSDQTISAGETPNCLQIREGVSGGWSSKDYIYQWQRSDDNVNWVEATDVVQVPVLNGECNLPSLHYTTYYRRQVKTKAQTAYSNSVKITVLLEAGTISSNQSLSPGSTPQTLTNTKSASGGSGSYAYQWQSSTDNSNWTNISGAADVSYSPGPVSQNTYYRRVVNSDGQQQASNSVLITVQGGATTGTAGTNNVISFTYTEKGGAASVSTVEYYDGLGRPIQTITVNGDGKDVAQFTEYDNMGRVSKSFLPVPVGSTNGQFVDNIAVRQKDYYKGKFGADGDYAYSIATFENAPTAIPILASGPGQSGNAHPTKTEIRRCGENTITKYELLSANPLRVRKTNFPSGALIEKKIFIVGDDANQANVSYEYTDSNGLVVATLNDSRQGTYYCYDDLGRVVATIPESVHVNLSPSSEYGESDLIAGCPLKYYDMNGNVIRACNPGSEYVINIYDSRNRLRMSQSGNLREKNQWTFTKYDGLDRPIISGLITGGSQDEHRSEINHRSEYEERNNTGNHLYTDWSYPQCSNSNVEVLTVSYYDDYEWVDIDWQANSAFNESVEGKVTRTKNKVLDEDIWLNTVIYYDDNYQQARINKQLYPSGTEICDYTYNFVGDVTLQKIKQTVNGSTYGYDRWYEYNTAGQLLNIKQQMLDDSSNGVVSISSFKYDDLGQVVKKGVHNGLDETTFKNDIAGRLMSVSSSNFSYELGYNTARAGGCARYDGKIAEMIWKNPDGAEKAYLYTYDKLGQLTKAQHAIATNGAFAQAGSYKEEISYASDLTGNITSIRRTDGNSKEQIINMNYDGYRLTNVSVDNNQSGQYTYDRNGNMISDRYDNTTHNYNILNRLQSIVGESGENMKAVYSSSGEKLAVSTAYRDYTTYYRGEFMYTKGNDGTERLSQVHHPEGTITKSTGGYTYNYFKTDHLGNVRVLLGANSGRMTVLQVNEYYAFGLSFAYNNLHVNKFLYNGKEFYDDVCGSYPGYYDFGSRTYNPFLGRWFQTDPQNQFINPYLYCGNNPVMGVDPDGEFFFSFILGPIGAIIDAACWGAVIGGASYTLSVALSDGGFDNWRWSDFGRSVGFGALGGAITGGIGSAFAQAGSFAGNFGTEALRGIAHGLAQGGLAELQGGDFWNGFASGALGSWVGSAYQASGLAASLGKGGMYAFGGFSGGVGSWATGGNFWQGAANGIMVTGLNHLQHEVSTLSDRHKTLEKYNEYVKNANSVTGAAADLTQQFTPDEIVWLVKTGRITGNVVKSIGWLNTVVDASIAVDSYNNGKPWQGHTYNAAIGAVGAMGPYGATAAAMIDSYVGGAKWLGNAYYWINTRGQSIMMNKIIRGY